MCARELYRGAIDVKVDTQGCGLGENAADLGFELGVKSRETSSASRLVLAVLRMLNSTTPEAGNKPSVSDEPTTRERSNEERERREHAVQNMNHTQQGQERLRHVNINHPTVSLY